jgi:transposase InsO family protein
MLSHATLGVTSVGEARRFYKPILGELGLILEAVELATLERASWFNNYRLMAPLDYVPPVEFEDNDYHSRNLEQQAMPA